jgi:hypothetical protein
VAQTVEDFMDDDEKADRQKNTLTNTVQPPVRLPAKCGTPPAVARQLTHKLASAAFASVCAPLTRVLAERRAPTTPSGAQRRGRRGCRRRPRHRGTRRAECWAEPSSTAWWCLWPSRSVRPNELRVPQNRAELRAPNTPCSNASSASANAWSARTRGVQRQKLRAGHHTN